MIRVLTVILFCCLAAGPALANEIVRRGAYELEYFGFDVGAEQFTIERAGDGYVIRARLEMKKGDQPSSEGIYHLDEQRRVKRVEYRELTENGVEATYQIEGDELIAQAMRGGELIEEIRLPADGRTLITGPHYVTDFFVLDPLSVDIGDETVIRAYTFGFEGWAPVAVEFDAKRERDRRVRSPQGDKIEAEVIRCEIRFDGETFKTRSWLDDQGVSNRITIDRTIGYVDIRLREPKSESSLESGGD